MKCAFIDYPGSLELAELDRPEPPPGEALVRVLEAGICSTDLELLRGYMAFRGVPGHEFVGRVESAPPEHSHLIGRRVVGEINVSCGRCETCASGLVTHCPTRSVLGILCRGGSLAEYLCLPAANLHPVPEGLPLDRALFTEPLAAACRIPEQVPVAGRHTLVLGAGKLGGLVARVLALKSADVVVLGHPGPAIELLRSEGLRAVDDPARVKSRSFELVVEATGNPAGFELALSFVRPCGTVVLKSTCAAGRPLNLAPVVIDEVTVIGSRCGPFAPALEMLATGRVRPETTIAARFALSEVQRAFKQASRPGTLKVVVEMAPE